MLVELGKQLYRRLSTLSLYNNWHYLALTAIFTVGAFFTPWLFIFHIPLFIVLYKKGLLVLSLIISFFIIISLSFTESIESKIDINQYYYSGTVLEAENDKYIVSISDEKVIIYTEVPLSVGDKIEFTATLKEPFRNQDETSFDYQKYLKRKGIFYTGNAKNIVVKEKTFSINYFRQVVGDYLEKIDLELANNYLKPLIIGDKGYSDETLIANINAVGISHLFAISGLHVGIIVAALKKILGKFKKKDLVIIVFLLFYMMLTGFTNSVLRASLGIILLIVSRKFKWKLGSLDGISIVALFLLIINPYSLFDLGFELSFIVAAFLILSKDFLKGNKLFVLFKISVIAQIATIPILANLNNEINLLSILYNVPLVLFFSTIFLPASIIVTIFPFFIFLYRYLSIALTNTINLLSNYSILIPLPFFNSFWIVLYYIGIIYLLFLIDSGKAFKGKLTIMLMVFILFINQAFFSSSTRVYVFDVNQGDSIFITVPNSQSGILVDAYGDIVHKLRSRGIYKLEALIISHSHDDHIGSAHEALDKLSVSAIYISFFDKSELIDELINDAKKREIPVFYLKANMVLEILGITFHVLGPFNDNDNLNNISLILHFSINDKSFLLMGDAEIDEINCMMDYYGAKIRADYLKLGHHGSRNSTTKRLLDLVNPSNVIISVGENNNYGLPDEDVIELLKRRKINYHLTSQEGNFLYEYWNFF